MKPSHVVWWRSDSGYVYLSYISCTRLKELLTWSTSGCISWSNLSLLMKPWVSYRQHFCTQSSTYTTSWQDFLRFDLSDGKNFPPVQDFMEKQFKLRLFYHYWNKSYNNLLAQMQRSCGLKSKYAEKTHLSNLMAKNHAPCHHRDQTKPCQSAVKTYTTELASQLE